MYLDGASRVSQTNKYRIFRLRKPVPWWYGVHEMIPDVLKTRGGASVFIAFLIGVLSTPWLLVVLLLMVALGVVIALLINASYKGPPPSIFK